MKVSEIEKYQKRLRRLVENIPEGYKLCYDMMDCMVYVVAKDAEFFDNEKNDVSAGYAGGGCPKGITGFNSDTGRDANKVIGSGIYIDMEAVQAV